MPYRAVIFDLDGTLLDTLEDLADSMNAVLEQQGYPAHPSSAYRYFVGDGVEMLVRRCLPEREWSTDQISRYVDAMEEEYSRRWDVKTRPYPGIPELLDSLEERNFPKGIFSNKPDGFTQLTVEKLLSTWNFHPVKGALPDIPRKPDPTGALAVAAQLDVDPADCLYLGDTNTDMKTALAAGMYPLGATWGFRPAAELQASGARRLLDHPMELLDLL
jgi:phosphoglycolate phosphatase